MIVIPPDPVGFSKGLFENVVRKATFSRFQSCMLTIAVTGGVACGKSSFCRRLVDRAPSGKMAFFSCDAAVKELLGDSGVLSDLRELGTEFRTCLVRGETLERELFRELLFENSDFRGRVEAVLHPLVLRRVVDFTAGLSDQTRILLVEVPLLYEVGFPISRNLDVAVVSSESVQMQRLQTDRGLDGILVRRILRSQFPNEEKIKRADIVVWNDGSRDTFEAQADHLLSRCEPYLNT